MDLAHAPLDELADRLRDRLLAEAAQEPGDGTLHGRIAALVDREAGLLDAATRADLAARIARRSFGLGPLEPLLADPAVDEVMVNGTAPVWVERAGRLEVTGVAFADEAALRHAIERVLAPLGRRVDEAEPLCDARLPDRTRRVRRLSAHERRLGRASCWRAVPCAKRTPAGCGGRGAPLPPDRGTWVAAVRAGGHRARHAFDRPTAVRA